LYGQTNMLNLIDIIKFIVSHPFNQGAKILAISRFIKYQVATRLINAKFLVDWVDDSKFLVSAGETGLTGNLYCGFMEYEDMCFLLRWQK